MDNQRAYITALRKSHIRLAELAGSMDESDMAKTSYADEWTIAQVYSHLGSGAELGMQWLEAALEHEPQGPSETNEKVWAEWNARTPHEQVTEAVRTNNEYVSRFEALSDEELEQAHIKLFDVLELSGFGIAQMRTSEAVIHTWDADVALDPQARLLPAGVELLIDPTTSNGWLAKPQPNCWTLGIHTTSPERHLMLENSADSVSLTPREGTNVSTENVLDITAEAFIRLMYGRVDDANDDGAKLNASNMSWADLKAVYQGI